MTHAQAPSPEVLRPELQEAITTFRHQWAQLLQGLGILVSADAILLGYGFAQKLSSVLLVASVMPLAALAGYIASMTGLVPVCYVAIRLEQKLSLHDVPFVGIWVKTRGDLPAAISDFSRLTDLESGNSTLKVPASYFLKNTTSRAILVIFALQIALVVVSIFGYHFRFM